MEILVTLVWLGGVVAAPESFGFWKTMVWPFYLGEALVKFIPE